MGEVSYIEKGPNYIANSGSKRWNSPIGINPDTGRRTGGPRTIFSDGFKFFDILENGRHNSLIMMEL